jgi:hypothetical protein
LFETPEIPEVLGDTNFAEGEFRLVPIPYETYDPLYVPDIPPVPQPGDNVTVSIAGQKQIRQGATIYRASLKIPITLDLDTIVSGFSSLTINGIVIPHGNSPSVISGGFINILWPGTQTYIVPDTIQISAYSIRLTNGSDTIDYIYSGPTVIFNASEINNGVRKDFETEIQDV